MGYIYKITNKINGKVYIGQTIRTIQDRWKEHIRYSFTTEKGKSYNSILHKAIRKYGVDAFDIEEVEHCDNDSVIEREEYWIKYYNSAKGGYNISLGGHGYKKCSDDEILRYWDEGKTVKEISELMPLCNDTISRRLKSMGVLPEEILARKHLARRGIWPGTRYATKVYAVYQYDLDGNFIREFESTKSACETLGLKYLRTSEKTYGRVIAGYQWRKFKADNIGKPKERNFNNGFKRKVVKANDNFGVEEVFKSVKSASDSVGVCKAAIINVCRGKHEKCRGFRWFYYEDAVAKGIIAS